jgi:hypothetical protein
MDQFIQNEMIRYCLTHSAELRQECPSFCNPSSEPIEDNTRTSSKKKTKINRKLKGNFILPKYLYNFNVMFNK